MSERARDKERKRNGRIKDTLTQSKVIEKENVNADRKKTKEVMFEWDRYGF